MSEESICAKSVCKSVSELMRVYILYGARVKVESASVLVNE